MGIRRSPDLPGFFARELGGEAQIQLFVTPGGTHGFGWHDHRFRSEDSPLGTATLIAGDWLYIPPGWWQRGKETKNTGGTKKVRKLQASA
jgi:hypothetical protein